MTTATGHCSQQVSFDSPTLVFADRVEVLPPEVWSQEARWIEAISSKRELSALILPLELGTASKLRQRMHGIRLLYWLRWGAEEPVRFLPVLVLSWQSA